MTKSTLFWQVYERLVDDEAFDPYPRRLVEAAFASDRAIRDALAITDTGLAAESSVAEADIEAPPAVYLERLDVTGFRGIGEQTTLNFEASPGLTVVVGRNGSGKSSIAESLEVLLTGHSMRWKDRRQSEWLSGWKNLHYKGRTWIRGTFLVEGSGTSLQVQRSWSGDELGDDEVEVEGDEAGAYARWEAALTTFRPILSYNEIGHALDGGPSHLYDLLRGVLGMEELTQAVERLAAARKDLRALDKERERRQKALDAALTKSDDERAARAGEALKGRSADLDALMELVVDEITGDAEVTQLRRIAALQVPELDEVLAAAAALRAAADAAAAADEMLADKQGQTIELLKKALSLHEHQPGETCPVCGTPDVLTDDWRAATLAQVEEVESSSQARRDAKQGIKAAMSSAAQLLGRVPGVSVDGLASAQAATAARAVWADAPAGPRELADHLEAQFDGVEFAYKALCEEAKEELRSLQVEWRPIRRAIEAFIEAAEAANAAKGQTKALNAAEKWLKEADGELRTERFAPICEQAQAIWDTLRHRSNVALTDIRLEGSKTRRRVELEVAVDGENAVALGVMSQGELHSMLLSLFLPRLTLEESPFRFLVVDDPVQAMDPAKVDGLARVLADVATKRQVVVFTHDARLPEALRRMQIPARIVEVQRAERSAVTLRDTRSRPAQFIADAFQVCDDQSKFGPRVAPNVVPGLCRGAIEAHLQAQAWEKLLREGHSHSAIEAQIAKANTVTVLAALAFFGDASRGGDVLRYLKNKVNRGADIFATVKDGAHGDFQGDVRTLVTDTRALLRGIGAQV